MSHIVLDDQASAEAVLAALSEGQTFEALAREKSIDTETGLRDGVLGYISFAQMPEAYVPVVYGLADGQVSAPFKVGAKWVVVRVEGRRKVPPPSFRSSKREILEFLRLQAIDQTLEQLRAESDVRLFSVEEITSPEVEADVDVGDTVVNGE